MRPKTVEFMKANDESPVVAGRAIGEGGQGAVYTLDNGRKFSLGVVTCMELPEGYPRWRL